MTDRRDRSYEQGLRDLEGEAGKVWRAVYGQDDSEFGKIVDDEAHRRRRPGDFHRTMNNRKHKKKR